MIVHVLPSLTNVLEPDLKINVLVFIDRNVLIYMLHFVDESEPDVRIRLRWMRISGANNPSVEEVELYQDTGTTVSCQYYGTTGTSPCDDVLMIPVTSTQLFRYVKISVPDYLNFCEVLVYAG